MFFNYIMIEAENDPANAPTLIWYNGGWCPIRTQFHSLPLQLNKIVLIWLRSRPDRILVYDPPNKNKTNENARSHFY
jgi:hypothetical protein